MVAGNKLGNCCSIIVLSQLEIKLNLIAQTGLKKQSGENPGGYLDTVRTESGFSQCCAKALFGFVKR